MAVPVDPGADYAAVVDGLDPVTVESIDPDTGAVLATATAVKALKGKQEKGEQGTGEGGGVGFTARDFTLVAGTGTGFSFTPKERDRITLAGVKWLIGDVVVGGFGGLYQCRGCTRER